MSAYALTDSATMLRRQLRHMLRYPALTLMLVGMPIVLYAPVHFLLARLMPKAPGN